MLSGEDTAERFAHIDTGTRNAILEILCATKSDLPEYWKKR